MRIRPLLLSSAAAITVLLGSSFTPSSALAQKGGVLSPSSQWVVTKAGDQSGGAGTYCALARRFQSGAVLTVARNQAGESSLAVDFRSRQFNESRSIPVTLDPGAGQQRDYEIVPASDKALVVRMGADVAFFDALEKTGYLRAEIEGRSYNFDLADIEQGQGQLSACVANLVMPAAGEEEAASGDAYREEINALRRQVEALRQQNDGLRQAAQEGAASFSNDPEQDKALEALKAENARLKEVVQDYSSGDAHDKERIAALETRAQALEAENRALSGDIERSRSDTQAHFEMEMQRYQDENAALKGRLDEKSEEEGARLTSLQDDLEVSRRDNEALKARLEAAQAQLTAIQQAKKVPNDEHAEVDQEKTDQMIAVLDQKVTALDFANQRLIEDVTSAKIAVQDSEAALQALQAEKDRLAAALDDANRALESARSDKAQALEKVAAATDTAFSLEESAAQIEAAQLEVEQVRAERLKADEVAQAASQRVEELEKELERAQRENEALAAQRATLEAEKKQALAGQADDVAALKADHERLQADMAEKLLAFDQEKGELETVLTVLRQDNETLREENSGLRAALANQEVAAQQALDRLEALNAAEGGPEFEVQAMGESSPAETETLRQENLRLKADAEALEERLRSADIEKQKEMQDLARQYIRVKRLYEDSLAGQTVPKAASVNPDDTGKAGAFETKKVSATVSTLSGEPVAVSLQPVPEDTLEIKIADNDEIALTDAQRFEEGMKIHRAEVVPLLAEETKQSGLSSVGQQAQDMIAENRGDAAPATYAILPEGLVPLEEEIGEAGDADPHTEAIARVTDDISAAAIDREVNGEAFFGSAAHAVEQHPLPPSSMGEGLYRPSFALDEFLDQAQFVRPARLDVVQAASGPTILAYQWQEDKIFASAEQKPLPDAQAFDRFVMDYLQRTQARCPSANFAILPDDTAQRGDVRVDSYEVACVGSGVSSSASLLFFNKNGTFTAMAHEAPTENMEEAMALRDRLFKAITES